MEARDVKGTKSDRIVVQRGRVLPKTIFAKYEMDDHDPYLSAADEIEELAEKGETAYVGEYQLVKVRKVDLKLRIG